MSSSFFLVDGQPVFLTFRKYSEVLQMCEDAGKISENDSFRYEMADDKKLHKKVYNAICQCLFECKKSNIENYNLLYYNSSCYDEEAEDNLFRLLDAMCTYYNDFYLETVDGKKIFEAIDGKDIGDIRFVMGKRYYLYHSAKQLRTNMSIFIDTSEVESFHGNLECFIMFFSTGLVLKMNHGAINIYYEAKSPIT